MNGIRAIAPKSACAVISAIAPTTGLTGDELNCAQVPQLGVTKWAATKWALALYSVLLRDLHINLMQIREKHAVKC